eukprot:symbB.v1.2.003713.t1/scaffold209.1/size267950/11
MAIDEDPYFVTADPYGDLLEGDVEELGTAYHLHPGHFLSKRQRVYEEDFGEEEVQQEVDVDDVQQEEFYYAEGEEEEAPEASLQEEGAGYSAEEGAFVEEAVEAFDSAEVEDGEEEAEEYVEECQEQAEEYELQYEYQTEQEPEAEEIFQDQGALIPELTEELPEEQRRHQKGAPPPARSTQIATHFESTDCAILVSRMASSSKTAQVALGAVGLAALGTSFVTPNAKVERSSRTLRGARATASSAQAATSGLGAASVAGAAVCSAALLVSQGRKVGASKSSITALQAFEQELGVQAPVGYWDPAGLAKDGDVETFKRRRSVELKHGRIAMLATMGYITPEIAGKFPGYLSPSAGLKFADVPNGLAAISKVPPGGWTQILLYMGWCEVSRGPGSDIASGKPGDFGWYVLTSADPEAKKKKLNAELANGRLAMMAIIGMFYQDGLTGSAWGDWSLYTDSPLRAEAAPDFTKDRTTRKRVPTVGTAVATPLQMRSAQNPKAVTAVKAKAKGFALLHESTTEDEEFAIGDQRTCFMFS